jgi:hypothetical protein
VGEAVGPLQVGDDDDLVRARHRLVQVTRRSHREAHVGNGPLHLMLVVGDHWVAATLDDDLRQRVGLVQMIVVGDDRHDVVRLD